MRRSVFLFIAVLWAFAAYATVPDTVTIDINAEVTYNDYIASDGYWEFRVDNNTYEIYISCIETTQAAGVYTVSDLDPEFSYIKILSPLPYRTVTFVEANLTLTETNTSHSLEGTVTGSDGKIYVLRLYSGIPTAQTNVNVVIPEWAVYNGYQLFGILSNVYAGVADDGTYIQIAIEGSNTIGSFTLANCVTDRTEIKIANASKSIYSLTVTVSENAEGVVNITADILCTNNTNYHVTTPAPTETGINQTDAANQAIKRVHNGQVVIDKAGKTYNMNGVLHQK